MSVSGAHIRSVHGLDQAVRAAWGQWERLEAKGCAYGGRGEVAEALRNRQLCFAHAVYLEAVRYALRSGVGSRGSSISLDPNGLLVHKRLDENWRITPENEAFRDKVLETVALAGKEVQNEWVDRRSLPETDAWFETAWARFRNGQVYD